MSVRAVIVAHREALAAEGIGAALGAYPGLVTIGVASSAADAERHAARADAVAIDERLPGAGPTVVRLLKRGLRVVVMGAVRQGDEDDAGLVVPFDAPVSSLAAALAPGSSTPGGRAELSAREQQVLELVTKGLAAKQIARTLGISPKTVEQHKTSLFRKLGVPNQAAAVAVAATDRTRSVPWNPSST